MKFCFTQSARPAAMASSPSFCSASATNASASSTVGGPAVSFMSAFTAAPAGSARAAPAAKRKPKVPSARASAPRKGNRSSCIGSSASLVAVGLASERPRDPLDAAVELCDRGGEREADVIVGAERRAGDDGDPRRLEQVLGELDRGRAVGAEGLLRARKGVEGSPRRPAREARDRVEPGNQEIAPLLVGREHALDVRLAVAQGGEGAD